MIYEKLEEGVWSLSNVLTDLEYESLSDEFDKPIVAFKKEEYAPNQSCIWLGLSKPNVDSVGDSALLISIGERVKYTAMRILQKKVRLDRINTNIQFKQNDTVFHTDGPNHHWTFLVFYNDTWNVDWGGEFIVNYDARKYRGISYIPDNGVLFNAAMPHRGTAGNNLSERLRYSIAFTYEEV